MIFIVGEWFFCHFFCVFKIILLVITVKGFGNLCLYREIVLSFWFVAPINWLDWKLTMLGFPLSSFPTLFPTKSRTAVSDRLPGMYVFFFCYLLTPFFFYLRLVECKLIAHCAFSCTATVKVCSFGLYSTPGVTCLELTFAPIQVSYFFFLCDFTAIIVLF